MTSAADLAALLHMLGGFAFTGALFGSPLCAFILYLALGALTAECCGVALIVPALALLAFAADCDLPWLFKTAPALAFPVSVIALNSLWSYLLALVFSRTTHALADGHSSAALLVCGGSCSQLLLRMLTFSGGTQTILTLLILHLPCLPLINSATE